MQCIAIDISNESAIKTPLGAYNSNFDLIVKELGGSVELLCSSGHGTDRTMAVIVLSYAQASTLIERLHSVLKGDQ